MWNAGIMVKASGFEIVPAGLVTVMKIVSSRASSADGTAAVAFVGVTKRAGREAPPKFTVVPAVKPIPSTVRIKAASPTAAPVGEIEPIARSSIASVTPLDVAPSGVTTVIAADPTAAIREGGTCAVNCTL